MNNDLNHSLPIDMTDKGQFHNLLDGYIRFYSTDKLTSFLSNHQMFDNIGIPFAITVFGEILLWKDNKYIIVLDIIKNKVQMIAPTYERFVESLNENTYVQQYFLMDLYKKAEQKLGELSIDECYGFVPFIMVDNKDLNSLEVVKWKEYLEIVIQFTTR